MPCAGVMEKFDFIAFIVLHVDDDGTNASIHTRPSVLVKNHYTMPLGDLVDDTERERQCHYFDWTIIFVLWRAVIAKW